MNRGDIVAILDVPKLCLSILGFGTNKSITFTKSRLNDISIMPLNGKDSMRIRGIENSKFPIIANRNHFVTLTTETGRSYAQRMLDQAWHLGPIPGIPNLGTFVKTGNQDSS